MNKFQTRQAQLPPSLRSLTLSTKLERMKAYSNRSSPLSGSPLSGSPGYSALSMSSPESPRTPSTASDEVPGFTSLPPPPRRTRPRRVPVPEYAPEETSEVPKLTIKTFRRQSAMSLDEAVVAESPTMAWLQREEQTDNRGSRGSIFGQLPQPVTIEEEPRTEGEATATKAEEKGEKRVSAAIAAAKAALEEAAAVDTDASGSKLGVAASNANPNPESVRPESSLGDIRVAEKQYFKTSKPRIISAVPSPTTPHHEQDHDAPTRLPVDDRDSPPPTPAQSEGLTVTANDGIALKPVPLETDAATNTAQPHHHHTWSPGHHANFSSATLPLRIEKRPRNMSERSTVSLPPPSSAPAGHKFLVPKGSITSPSREHRTRSKLVKSKSATTVDMHQLRAFIASRDGAASERPADAHRDPSRPLISHAKSLSRSSGCSMDSSTTYNPPSTIDICEGPRVSISSTIYTSSNDHAASVPNTANRPQFPPLSPGIESFIGSSSEEGEFNPYAYQRHDILHEIQSEQVIDSDNYQLMSILSGTNMNTLNTRSRSPKPPVPRTPKPIFSRKPFSASSSPMHSPTSSLVFEGYQSTDGWDPAAGNWLAQEERADLIKKSRKLARVFGTTPGADIMAYQESRSVSQSRASKHRHLRTPLSISNDLDNTVALRQRRASAWPSPTESHFSNSSSSRRHSAPLSPDDISFLNVSSPLYEASFAQVASQFRPEPSAAATTSGSQVEKPSNVRASVTDQERSANTTGHNRASSPSRTSFIDWSDEEGLDDGLSIISQEPPSKLRRPTSPTHSLFENLTPEEQAEEERRRKREKLAKLHRFLGSRVPVNLVVGLDFENDMPSQSPRPTTTYSTGSGSAGGNTSLEFDESSRKAWIRRRRSSSAAALPSWSDDMDRLKEELDTKEKLLNVRRAQKMEKVFGVAPPQTLYHTRGHTPSPSLPSLAPVAAKTIGNPSAFIPSSDAMHFTRNPNRSSYDKSSVAKLSRRRTGRPSTAESTKHLIPKGRRSSSTTSFNFGGSPPKESRFNKNQTSSRGPFNQEQPRSGAWTSSAVYNHYQHSLNSLNDIIDRDDRESLLELHTYLNQEQADQEVEELHYRGRERRLSDSSILTERRRSCPPDSASITSFGSEHATALDSATTPTKGSDLTDFQQRRRRAAKLTQFFGVQYRELINDVLDSLENGLEHEQKRGTLQADEIADLLNRLRELKVKREGIKA